ncbi:hypothetical protein IE53DRAFT_370344 [Violaceomyces palustris]|uniref:Uncharacterized protein n=1 Tax=Violaceomyces palustris TaxID=1673888 RepID=A0ACD0NSF7_9BASI|nr:hypothetical protein IE53DRAFT_370344 [Violaceomyces palustris]
MSTAVDAAAPEPVNIHQVPPKTSPPSPLSTPCKTFPLFYQAENDPKIYHTPPSETGREEKDVEARFDISSTSPKSSSTSSSSSPDPSVSRCSFAIGGTYFACQTTFSDNFQQVLRRPSKPSESQEGSFPSPTTSLGSEGSEQNSLLFAFMAPTAYMQGRVENGHVKLEREKQATRKRPKDHQLLSDGRPNVLATSKGTSASPPPYGMWRFPTLLPSTITNLLGSSSSLPTQVITLTPPAHSQPSSKATSLAEDATRIKTAGLKTVPAPILGSVEPESILSSSTKVVQSTCVDGLVVTRSISLLSMGCFLMLSTLLYVTFRVWKRSGRRGEGDFRISRAYRNLGGGGRRDGLGFRRVMRRIRCFCGRFGKSIIDLLTVGARGGVVEVREALNEQVDRENYGTGHGSDLENLLGYQRRHGDGSEIIDRTPENQIVMGFDGEKIYTRGLPEDFIKVLETNFWKNRAARRSGRRKRGEDQHLGLPGKHWETMAVAVPSGKSNNLWRGGRRSSNMAEGSTSVGEQVDRTGDHSRKLAKVDDGFGEVETDGGTLGSLDGQEETQKIRRKERVQLGQSRSIGEKEELSDKGNERVCQGCDLYRGTQIQHLTGNLEGMDNEICREDGEIYEKNDEDSEEGEKEEEEEEWLRLNGSCPLCRADLFELLSIDYEG